MDILELSLIFTIGFVGSFVGSIAAGAALITVPGLLLLGLPPQIALASARFGELGFKTGSFFKFAKHKTLVWDLVLPLSIMAIIGGAIGARILVVVNEDILTTIVGVVLILLLPALFLRKGIGIEQRVISKLRRKFSHVVYFLVKIWQGFFSPGSGFFDLYVYLNGYGLTILQSKGTSRIPGLLAVVSATIVFWSSGLINLEVGFMLLIGMLIGGYMGAHVAIKKGDAWIKPIMAVFILFVGIKMIFF